MNRKVVLFLCLAYVFIVDVVGQKCRYNFNVDGQFPHKCLVVSELFDADNRLLFTEKAVILTDTSKQIVGYFNFGKMKPLVLTQAKTLRVTLMDYLKNTSLDVFVNPDVTETAYLATLNKIQSDRLLVIENRLVELGLQELVTFWYNGEPVTYGVVKYKGRFWLDRNLGAQRVARAIHDTLSYGHLFQWGREDDGHQLCDNPIIETELAGVMVQPGHNAYIFNDKNTDWNQNSKWVQRWHNGSPNVETSTNVCPEGWHVPTQLDWEQAISGWRNNADAYSSPLKLPSIYVRHGKEFSFRKDEQHYNTSVHYWSSTPGPKPGVACATIFYNSRTGVFDQYNIGSGFGVRCIKDLVYSK